MPGPRNMKKKSSQNKKARRQQEPEQHNVPGNAPITQIEGPLSVSHNLPQQNSEHNDTTQYSSHHAAILQPESNACLKEEEPARDSIPSLFTTTPFIYDPGNGPRVRDAPAFLASSFASPPSLDDPLCAQFAQEEMVDMLACVLPQETAMVGSTLCIGAQNTQASSCQILWYNRSRRTARICPACQRLYRLGDILPDHLTEAEADKEETMPSPQLLREQELSGLCTCSQPDN